MITALNEFETVKAFTHIAGCSLGTWTDRETTYRMITVAELVSTHINVKEYYKDLAKLSDEDISGDILEMQQEIAQELNYYMPADPSCSVSLQNNEWTVLPYIDEDAPKFGNVPNDYINDVVYIVNDHGNVDCYQWNDQKREYVYCWGTV